MNDYIRWTGTDKQNAKVRNADFCKTEASLLSILCVVLLYFQGKSGRDLHCTKDKGGVATAPGAKHCILSLSKPLSKSVGVLLLQTPDNLFPGQILFRRKSIELSTAKYFLFSLLVLWVWRH